MNTRILAVWGMVCTIGAASPGDLDRSFDPELRAWVTPNHVTLAQDGRAWIGGGFDRADGFSTGDLVRLGNHGGVEAEPAAGYLERNPSFTYQEVFYPSSLPGISDLVGYQLVDAPPAAPFLLADGDFLLPTASLNWLRMGAGGEVIGKAFPDRRQGETITPQFEREGKLWVVRKLSSGRRVLECRHSADGALDPGFVQAANWPADPREVVAGPGGTVWVLAGPDVSLYGSWGFHFSEYPARHVFQVDSAGGILGAARLLEASRPTHMAAGPAGGYRIMFGPRLQNAYYWPGFSYGYHTLEFCSAAGVVERRQNFSVILGGTLVWAEGADGSLLAGTGALQRFAPGGGRDLTFKSPGRARSVKALADGKWLIDGLRRIQADGSDDMGWTAPKLDKPADVKALVSLGDGRVLAAGNFAMADGYVKNRLLVFLADGAVDPSFTPDERIGEWRSVAVSGRAIYVVTAAAVHYGNGIVSNLLKLRRDGAVDENFRPRTGGLSYLGAGGFQLTYLDANLAEFRPSGIMLDQRVPLPISIQTLESVTAVSAMDRGDILVETNSGGEVAETVFYRLRPDGAQAPGFKVVRDQPRAFETITRSNGGFVRGAVIYRRDGTIERDLTSSNVWLRPLCEWRGGVVFLEYGNGATGRLRLWMEKNAWSPWFQPPPIANIRDGVVATPGEPGWLHVSATFTDGRTELRRVFLTGRVDQNFQAPQFARHERQEAGEWWKAEEAGAAYVDAGEQATKAGPRVLLFSGRRLWVGGDFNRVNGWPRDGIARLAAGMR